MFATFIIYLLFFFFWLIQVNFILLFLFINFKYATPPNTYKSLNGSVLFKNSPEEAWLRVQETDVSPLTVEE